MNLPVPFSPQQRNDYCLPACTQMVLGYWDTIRSQDELAQILEVFEDFGAPASNITRLNSRIFEVTYFVESTIEEIRNWLSNQLPIIAFVQTEQLAYWEGHRSQHAVVVVGIDIQKLYLLDPAFDDTPRAVLLDEFILAWDEMEFSCAVIQKRR